METFPLTLSISIAATSDIGWDIHTYFSSSSTISESSDASWVLKSLVSFIIYCSCSSSCRVSCSIAKISTSGPCFPSFFTNFISGVIQLCFDLSHGHPFNFVYVFIEKNRLTLSLPYIATRHTWSPSTIDRAFFVDYLK